MTPRIWSKVLAVMAVVALGVLFFSVANLGVSSTQPTKYKYTIYANERTPAIDAALKSLSAEKLMIDTKVDEGATAPVGSACSPAARFVVVGLAVVGLVSALSFLFEAIFAKLLTKKSSIDQTPNRVAGGD